MTTATATKWIRVTKRNPCPVCGKPDWCLISEDGKAAICARIESDRPAGSKDKQSRRTTGYHLRYANVELREKYGK